MRKRAFWQLLTLNVLLLLAQLVLRPELAQAAQVTQQCCQVNTEGEGFCCVCGAYACGPTAPACTSSSQCR